MSNTTHKSPDSDNNLLFIGLILIITFLVTGFAGALVYFIGWMG